MSAEPRNDAFVRWARITLLVVALVVAVASVAFVLRRGRDADQRFTCPMVEHAFVVTEEPGECPLCHMKLVPMSAAAIEARRGEVAPSPVKGLSEVSLHEEQAKRAGVRTVAVEEATLKDPLVVSTEIVASEDGLGRVHARAAGFVERLVVSKVGQKVRAGDTMAYLYAPEVYRAMEELLASARLEAVGASGAREAAARRLKLFGLGDKDIAAIEAKKEATRLIAIRAPASGTVTRKDVAVGAYVTPEMPLYELVDVSRSYAIAEVPVGVTLQPGTRGELRMGTETFDVEVELTLLDATRDTRATRVKLVPTAKGVNLRPGSAATTAFDVGARSTLSVPASALVDTGRRTYVFVDTGEKLVPRIVTVGRRTGERVEILGGVHAGERVVFAATFLIDAESRLTAAFSDSRAPATSKQAP